MVNVTFTPNGVKNSNAANTVKILSPDTVKQGDTKNDFLVQLIKDDVPLDLTGKTVTWSAASNKGKFVTDRPATVEGDGTVGIEFVGDDQGAVGSLRVEFKVTYSDGDVEKFPAQNYAYFEITRSLDDLSTTPVMYASVQYFEDKVAEVKTGQETFEQTVDGKIVELESTVQTGIGAFTEDTEVLMARGGEVNLGARLDKTTAQLAETGQRIDNIITTPVEGVSAQEIIDARKGEGSLGTKITKIDEQQFEQRKMIYDHYYLNGDEYIEKTGGWVLGYNNGTATSTITRNPTYIQFDNVYSGGASNAGFATDLQAVDVTNIDKIYIDWEQTEPNASARSKLLVSSNKSTSGDTIAGVVVASKFARQVSVLDTSQLTGLVHLRVHALGYDTSGRVSIKVFNIYTDSSLAHASTVEMAKNEAQKQMNWYAYLQTSSVNGFRTPEIVERNGAELRVLFKLRHSTHGIVVRPETTSNSFPTTGWSDLLVQLAQHVENGYIVVREGYCLVANMVAKNFEIVLRTQFDSTKHLLIILNLAGIVSAGEAINWRLSSSKVDDTSLPNKVVGLENLKDDVTSAISSGIGIATYYDAEKTRVINKVYNDMKDSQSGVFAYITDQQSSTSQDSSLNMAENYTNISHLSKELPVTMIANGGDFFNGVNNHQTTLGELKKYVKLTTDHAPVPVYISKGNHDDGSFYTTNNGRLYDDLITGNDWYNYVLKYFDRFGVFQTDKDNPTGGYSYIDDDVSKIRYMFLNGYDIPYIKLPDGTHKYCAMQNSGFSENQLNWVAKKCLNFENKETPSDWAVVGFLHYPDPLAVNFNILKGILTAFKTGSTYVGNSSVADFEASVSADFTTQGTGEFITFFCGHKHFDQDFIEIENGIHFITSDSSYYSSSDTDRAVRTETQDSFSVVVINREDKMIYMTRFGAGLDRNYNYADYTPKHPTS